MGSHQMPADVGFVSEGAVGSLGHGAGCCSNPRVDCAGLFGPRHFHPGLCYACLKKPPNSAQQPLTPPLMRCSQCQLVYYCSKTCQKKDWPHHRNVCKYSKVHDGQNVFRSAKDFVASGKAWAKFRQNLVHAATVHLKRPLLRCEREIFDYPRVCQVCKNADQPALASCPHCHSVFYCSSQHMEQDASAHSQHCTNYLLMIECDAVEANYGIQDLPIPVQVDPAYKNLPNKLMTLLKAQLEENSEVPLDAVTVTQVSERLSYPLSLLYAIQNIGIGFDNTALHDVKELRVHVVGAKSLTELLGIIRWEYLVHRLPALKRFHIVFIGPELFCDVGTNGEVVLDEHILDDSGMTMCEECSNCNRRIVYEMYSKCYHDFVSSSYYSVPDIIVAFNCGLHETLCDQSIQNGSPEPQFNQDSNWQASLGFLVEHKDIPFVFTSYTKEEAKLDLEAVQSATKVDILMESQENPFRSVRPYRDHEDNEPLFYYNRYITCVRRADDDNRQEFDSLSTMTEKIDIAH